MHKLINSHRFKTENNFMSHWKPTFIGSLLLCSYTSVTMVTATAEVIVSVGGEDDKVVLRSVESFDPVTNQWKNLACLPFAVSKHGLVVSGERLALTRFCPSWFTIWVHVSNPFPLVFSRFHSVFGRRRVSWRLSQQRDVALWPLLRLLDRDGTDECRSLRVGWGALNPFTWGWENY